MDRDFGRIYLTSNLPGTGGKIKDRPEDFIVKEVPLYEPSDEGGHSYLQVEKPNLSTLDLVSLIRTHLEVDDHQVGLAGWKDKRAVTSQWISVPREKISEERLERLNSQGIQVLQERHHPHKLRLEPVCADHLLDPLREPAEIVGRYRPSPEVVHRVIGH